MSEKMAKLCLLSVFVSFLLFPVLALPKTKTLNIIKEINKKGPYLGLITVYLPEEKGFNDTKSFKPDSKHPFVDLSGRRFRVGTVEEKKVIYLRSGVGLVNAAAATQQMLDLFNITGLVHFGISGNLNSSLTIGDVTIAKQFVNTGLMYWLQPNFNVTRPSPKVDIKDYNVPKEGNNSLGILVHRQEEFYSEERGALIDPKLLNQTWFEVNQDWLKLASKLEETELEQCVKINQTTQCLEKKPKVVIGVNGSSADTFVDNEAYRNFLYKSFGVSSADMESSAVVMTSLSNGFPVIVVRGLSDLAGAQNGNNTVHVYGSLAAANVAKVVVEFIKLLAEKEIHTIDLNMQEQGRHLEL